MSKSNIVPTHAGMVRFFETVKPILEAQHRLFLTATVTTFEVRNAKGKLMASGDSIDWLNGFVTGLATYDS